MMKTRNRTVAKTEITAFAISPVSTEQSNELIESVHFNTYNQQNIHTQ